MKAPYLLLVTLTLWTQQQALGAPPPPAQHGAAALPPNLPPALTGAAKAVGQLVVRPYSNPHDTISCTASHLGGGVMLTLGSCFLGAKECNRGAVTFLGTAQPNGLPWVSNCTEVIYARGDAGRYNSSGEDIALFRISNPPPFSVKLATSDRMDGGDGGFSSIVVAQGAWDQPPALVWSGPCSVKGPAVPLRQFHSPAHFRHFNSCDLPPGGSGAPLFDSQDDSVVGIQQNTFARNKVLFPSRWLPISNTVLEKGRDNVPQDIWLGYSLNNAVPTVPPSPVKMRVVTFPQNLGSHVQFAVRNLAQTVVVVEDGSGARTTFRGFLTENQLAPRPYPLPVKVYAYTEGDMAVLGAGLTGVRITQ